MQIDFHHAVTYVVARLAGFERAQAQVIAHSAQYVDDATSSGEIKFTNGAGYQRISSAHKALDYANLDELENARVWVPFHFLPGNGGLEAGKDPEGGFIRKLVCKPDSHVARDMLADCINHIHAPNGLHRLGIAMHVYADTWAHQGFAGLIHKINFVEDLRGEDGKPDEAMIDRVKSFFGKVFEGWASDTAAAKFPLGHGAALSHPDKPFLRWSYTNGLGDEVKRDNPEDYVSAVRHMFVALALARAELNGVANPRAVAAAAKLGERDLAKIEENLRTFVDDDGATRHALWLESIGKGDFSFGSERVTYKDKGRGSWKFEALRSERDEQDKDAYEYDTAFLNSNWKLFHDALQAHRLAVLHDILPKYGICVA